MAVKVLTKENRATCLYENTKKFEGTEVSIGFRCGAKLDGEIPGLSHFIEHMLTKGFNKKQEKQNITYSKENMHYFNLDTTQFSIKADVLCSNEDLKKNIDFILKSFKNRKFSQEMLRDELEIVKREMELNGGDGKFYKETDYDDVPVGTPDDIFFKLAINPPMENLEILGDYNKLKKLATPKVIAGYLDKYFNKSNLVMSVKSSLPFEEIKILFDYVESKLPNAKDVSCIVEDHTPTYFRPQVIENIAPYDESSNVDLNLIIRQREFASENINYEVALDIIEEKIFNGSTVLSGLFINNLRVDNNLCYYASIQNQDLITAKFKILNVNTNKKQLEKAIKKSCQFIKNIAENGISKKDFNEAKKSLLNAIDNRIFKIKDEETSSKNFCQYLAGFPFRDDKKILKYLRELTYEDFNNYIKTIYTCPNISLAVSGDFAIKDLGDYFIEGINTAAGNTIFGTKTPNSETTGADIRTFDIIYANKEINRFYEDFEEVFQELQDEDVEDTKETENQDEEEEKE